MVRCGEVWGDVGRYGEIWRLLQVPATEDSFYYYTFRLPFSGSLLPPGKEREAPSMLHTHPGLRCGAL